MKSIKVISWNVNGIRASVNKGFYDIFRELKPDIFCVQETKAQDDVMQKIAGELKDYHLFSSSAVKPGYSGTAVFSRIKPKSHHKIMGKKEHDQEGRIIALEFDGS